MRILLLGIFCLFSFLAIGQADSISESDVQTQSLFIDAIQFKLIDRHDLSIPKFREIIKKEPKNFVVWYELAFGLFKTKKYDEALDAAKKTIELHPQSIQSQELSAQIYHIQENYKDEIATYKKLSALYPLEEKYYTQLVQALKLEAKWDEAIKVLWALEQNKGINEISSLEKASLFELTKRPKEAEKELIKLTDAFPYDLKYLQTLANFYIIQKSDKVTEVYQKILAINPNDEKANLALAGSFKKSGQDDQYLTSISSLIENPAISIDAKIVELVPYISKAKDTKDLALFSILEKHANTLVKNDLKNPKAHALAADIYYLQNQDLNAFQSYQAAISAGKCPKSVWNNFLLLAPKFQSQADLAKWNEQAFDEFPTDAAFAVNYSKSLLFSGQKAEAKSILSQANLMANNQKNVIPQIQALKYIIATEENDLAASQAISKDPILLSSVDAQKVIAQFYTHQFPKAKLAKSWTESIEKLAPQDGEIAALKASASLIKDTENFKLNLNIENTNWENELKLLSDQVIKMESKDEKAKVYLKLANIHFRLLGDLKLASRSVEISILNNPESADAYLLAGDIYLAALSDCNDQWSSKLLAIAALDKYETALSKKSNLNAIISNKINSILSVLPDKDESLKKGYTEGQQFNDPCGFKEIVKLRFKP